MHETRDLHVRAVAVFGGVLLLVGIAIHLVIALFFDSTRRAADRADRPPHPLAQTPGVPPSPRLEAAPKAALQALRREEDQLLETYGWVDRAQGRVRVPISRALDLLEQKGLPVRPAPLPAD